jgi:DNA-binding GntR family transcriptional regulator
VLRDHVKEVIIERILDGTYLPGSRVVESRLAQEFGVSQAPVREALRDLEAMRFIESEPYRGARVRAVSESELAEIYPVRAALEEVAGRAAAPRMTGALLGQLAAELEEMRDAARSGDRHRQLVHDATFHRIIVEAAGNITLLQVWSSLRIEARTLVSVIKSESDLAAIADMHVPILDALRARDAEQAGKQMRYHIESFGALLSGPQGEGERQRAGGWGPEGDSG